MLIRLLRRLPIGLRLYLGFGGAIVLLAAALGAAAWLAHRDRAALVTGLNEASEKEHLADQMRSAVLAGAVGVRTLVTQADPAEMRRHDALVRQDLKIFRHARATLAALDDLSDSERATLDALVELERRLHAPVAEALALALAADRDGALRIVNEFIEPVQAQLLAGLTEFAELQTDNAKALFDAAESSGQATTRMLAAIGALAALVAAASTVLMIRSINVPLAAVVDAVNRVAQGDLRPVGADAARDEVGALRRAVAAMTRNLGTIVQRVRTTSEQIATASTEIATGNADLSARTESHAAGLQQTASSMQQLTQTVTANAAGAGEASALALAAARDAEAGGALVGEVVGTMDAIRSASARVHDITGVIDGIAFQTNILALNAAVEAARAGEQGRGFAVVAGEVRTLAQRSAEAAKEIKRLIADSVERVRDGSDLVAKAGATMQGIVRGVRAVHDAVGGISVASGEQADGIRQVNGAIEQMDRGTQQNAALVEQSAAAASSLAAQAAQLTTAVAEFRTA